MASEEPSNPYQGASSASSGRAKSTGSTPGSVRDKLRISRIIIGETEYWSDSNIQKLVSDYVWKARDSPGLTDQRAEEFRRTAEAVKTRNESDSVNALLPYIFPSPHYLQGGQQGLERTINAVFRPGCVPVQQGLEKEIQTLLDEMLQPPTPRPDVTFGYNLASFSEKQRAFNYNYLQTIAGIGGHPQYPFLIVEWKALSTAGKLHEAENQAARGGAAVVSSMLNFYNMLAAGAISKADLLTRTACFSATVDSQTITLWVHWFKDAEGGGCTYQMSRLGLYPLLTDPRTSGDAYRMLTNYVKNIIGWGLGVRLDNIKAALDALITQNVENPGLKRKTPSS